jgi:hypothetical protein
MHPEIEGATGSRKELHYFDRYHGRDFHNGDAAGYHTEFPPPGQRLRGEWTPRYMFDFWTPRLLAKAAPEAQLIVMLRDPVERYRSGVEYETELYGRHPMLGKIVADLALARSSYHRQLQRLLEYFRRSQILVLQYEQCVADPLGLYRRTLDFLGVGGFTPDEAQMRRPVGNVTQRAGLPDHVREAVVDQLAEDVSLLDAEFPEIDVSLWPDFEVS